MRTRIKLTPHGSVLLRCWDDSEMKLFERVFFAGSEPDSFVRENPDGRQVCEGLYSTGNTLTRGADLLKTIRREWRKNRRDARKMSHI